MAHSFETRQAEMMMEAEKSAWALEKANYEREKQRLSSELEAMRRQLSSADLRLEAYQSDSAVDGLVAELESREVAWQQERMELAAASKGALESAEAAQRATEKELAVCKEDLTASMEQLGEMQNMMAESALDDGEQADAGNADYISAMQDELDQEREDGEQLRHAVGWMRKRLEASSRNSARNATRQPQTLYLPNRTRHSNAAC
ncbi:hypothetical protein T484DRAFT_1811569 [Baffinella frigidus]|nr:hypothetical protein T484DRAFT_1811569 [Cryptophyta sp. CCMP2293]